jgi:hypothetical protein
VDTPHDNDQLVLAASYLAERCKIERSSLNMKAYGTSNIMATPIPGQSPHQRALWLRASQLNDSIRRHKLADSMARAALKYENKYKKLATWLNTLTDIPRAVLVIVMQYNGKYIGRMKTD